MHTLLVDNVLCLTNCSRVSLSSAFISRLPGFEAFSRDRRVSISGCFPAGGRGQPVRVRDHSRHAQTLLARYQPPVQRLSTQW